MSMWSPFVGVLNPYEALMKGSVEHKGSTNTDHVREKIKTDEGLAKQLSKYVPLCAWPKDVRKIWMSKRMSKEEAWLLWLQQPIKKLGNDLSNNIIPCDY